MEKERFMLCVVLCMGIFFTSCQNDNDDGLSNVSAVSATERLTKSVGDKVGRFKLISDEVVRTVNSSDNSSLQLRSSSVYGIENSIPIYIYYYHYGNSSIYNDHYYGVENSGGRGSALRVKGRTYRMEFQGFNLERKDRIYDREIVDLYRFYSPSANDHMLSYNGGRSVDGSVTDYKQEEYLGRIFWMPRLGTVPLWEYYSYVNKNHSYAHTNSDIIWGAEHERNYIKMKRLGFVYPGERVDVNKTPNSFRISKIASWPSCMVTMKFNVRVGGTYRTVTYNYYFGGESFADLTLESSYTVLSIDMTIATQIDRQSYTKTFHISAKDMVYSSKLNNNITLEARLYIKPETYYHTDIDIAFLDFSNR